MSKRFILTSIMAIVIFASAGVAVFLAKGYTFSTTERKIIGTGIISATSVPDSASVYVDNHLTTATNATISSLPPKKYTVKIIKEGFIPWEREVEVREGLVTELKVTLFPAIPTIYPLTFNGVKNPSLSPDASKLAFVVPTGKKAGVWVWTMSNNQPIAFARSAEPHEISQSIGGVDFSLSLFTWSSDSKQVIATIGNNNYLLDTERLNTDPRDITPSLAATLKTWKDDTKVKDEARLLTVKNLSMRRIASDSGILKWSPDETKFIYTESKIDVKEKVATSAVSLDPQNVTLKVYDTDTNKNYDLPTSKLHFWLPDSKHIVLIEEGKVSIIDNDGTNKAVIYAGNFLDNFVVAWPDSSRLIFISTFPTPTASEPNLYGINLK